VFAGAPEQAGHRPRRLAGPRLRVIY